MSYEQLEPGLYPFTIEDANIRYVSKAGNTSLRLVLKIQHDNKQYTAWDYLTYKNGPDGKPFAFIIKKKADLLRSIKQDFFLDKMDMLENETFIGKNGKCVIKIETHPDFGSQIKVVRYYSSVIEDKSPVRQERPSGLDSHEILIGSSFVDDNDIPF